MLATPRTKIASAADDLRASGQVEVVGAVCSVSVVAFTPKPRVVKLQLLPVAEERMLVSDSPTQVTRYHVRPQLGLFASLLVTDIPDVRMGILPGEAPAFLGAEGPLYFMGPIWRIAPH
jgi:hypothetical protein